MQKINLHNYEAFLLDYFDGNLNTDDLVELKTFALLNPQLNIDFYADELPSFKASSLNFENKTSLFKTPEDIYNEELLNYIEGNLSKQDKLNFELKLTTNTPLAKEVELYKKTNLKFIKQNLTLNKSNLLKTENDLILNNIALNYIENNLTEIEKINFETELKTNIVLQTEVTQLQKTKLITDSSVIYPTKNELKKHAKVIALFNFNTISAIAAGLLLLISLGFVLNFYFNSTTNNPTKIAVNPNNKYINVSKTKKVVDSLTLINNPINKNLMATNNNTTTAIKPFKNNFLKITLVNNINTSPIANTNLNSTVFKKDTNSIINTNTTNAVVSNTISLNTIATATNLVTEPTVQTTLLASEEDNDELSPTPPSQKNNFWKRAVTIAKQLNGLGIKAVKGNEKSTNNYLLAFNSISIEKK